MRHGVPARRLHLADIMILIAGAAVGLGITRVFILINPGTMRASIAWGIIRAASVWIPLGLTAATFAIGLRSPRPPLRRLAGHPGWLACAATILVVTLLLIYHLLSGCTAVALGHVEALFVPTYLLWTVTSSLPNMAASAILGSWMAMAMAGQLRMDRGAVDRIGRVLGVIWLVHSVVISAIFPWFF